MPIKRTRLLDRKVNVRDARLYVVATEGEKTEAQYLEMFQNSRVRVETLPTGEDGRSAPRQVLARLDEFRGQYDLGEEDELWLMIDVDRQRPEHLSEVCQQAVQKGVHLAVSNRCFEFWLCLHFAPSADVLPEGVAPEAIKCGYYEEWLRNRLGSYNKARLQAQQFQPHVDLAVERAREIDVSPAERWPTFPGTHVYRLIERLLAS